MTDTFPTIMATNENPSCPLCSIELDSIATIGAVWDSVYPMMPTTVVEGADQFFYVAPVNIKAKIAVYAWDGQLARMLSKAGEGPGENRGISAIFASRDSFIGVTSFSRVLWFPTAPNGNVITERLTHTLYEQRMLALPGRTLVAVLEQSRNSRTFGAFRANGWSLTFGDTLVASAGRENPLSVKYPHALAAVDSTRFWAMRQYLEPSLEVWNISGKLLRRFMLPAPWFPPYGMDMIQRLGNEGLRAVQIPITTSIWHDRLGRLWTLTNVGDPHWKSSRHLEPKDEQGNTQSRYWGYDRRKVLDAVIAVYELGDSTVALIASRRFDIPINRILSDSVAAEEAYPEESMIAFHLFRFRLVQPLTNRRSQ